MRTTPIILTAAILGTYCLPGESAAASTVAAEHGSSVTRKYRLYHSFGASGTNEDDDFVERGIVTLSSSDPATEALTAAVAVVEGADGSLPAERVDEMVAGGGMYRIRAVEDGGGGATAMASVPGCDVRRANFRCVFHDRPRAISSFRGKLGMRIFPSPSGCRQGYDWIVSAHMPVWI